VQGIILTVNQVYVQNIKLQIGQVSQEVDVQAEAVQVEHTSMELSTVVSANTIVDVPLNGRNWTQLQQLQPGVVAAASRLGNIYATNGNQEGMNSFLINGTDSNDLMQNTPLIVPSPDAIVEFQMVTSTIDSEFSRNSGAVINAAIKSGTNQFHGDLFDFYRDTALNGRDYFALAPAVFHQHQFGATLGGPVWKDHTFFFFSYQGTRSRQPDGGATQDVPSVAERSGNFSDPALLTLLNQSTGVSPIPLYGDAASSCPVSGGTPCPAGTPYGIAGEGVANPTALFSTGMIPTMDFNSVATNLVSKYVPVPNVGTYQYTFNPVSVNSDDQELFRIDHRFSEKDSIWWYSLFERNPTTDALLTRGATLPGFGGTSDTTTQQHTLAWTHVFNPATLNEFRLGSTYWRQFTGLPLTPTNPASAGFIGVVPQFPQYAGLPGVSVSGEDVGSGFTLGSSQADPTKRINHTYQVTDNFSKQVGHHTMKFGFEGRRFELNNPYYGLGNGNFSFGGSGGFSTGLATADFLLGFPSGYSQNSGGAVVTRAYEYYSFFQDQYKVRPNLTLTYGLSWDVETPLTDEANGGRSINCFSPGEQSTVYPTAPVGFLVPGDKGCSSAGYGLQAKSFSPRVGFAWSPNLGAVSGGPDKMAVRGGYGLYFDRSNAFVTLQNLSAPPFQLLDAGIGDVGGMPSFAAPFTDVRCIDQNGNPIPSCAPTAQGNPTPASIPNKYPFVAPPPGANFNFGFYEPMSLNVIDPNFTVPYVENYNLTIQRELPGQLILSVGYVGSSGHHLVSQYEQNPGINPAGCASDVGSEAGCADNPLLQYLLFPQNFKYNSNVFGSIGTEATIGNSNYNSLQVALNKSTSHGLTLGASYTYGHALDNVPDLTTGQGIDPFNFNRFYGDSIYDARQRLVIHYVYDLPSIRNFKGLRHLPKQLTDGWELGGITTFQTGFPVRISDSPLGFFGTTSLTCPGYISFYSCWDVPNIVGPVREVNPRAQFGSNTGSYWFDPSSFAHAALGTMGDAGRSVLHGPGINNWDLQLSKSIQFTEHYSLVLRCELFNAFNHAQFSNPDGNLADSTFGQITSTRSGPRIAQLAAKFYF
jgi:hypothetical protein